MSNKAEKRGLVPKLRFPEFRESGEWEEKPLAKLAKRCTQKNGQVKLSRVLTNSAEFGVVDQQDFFDKDIANQSNLEGYFVVEKGDYVYNPRISITAPVGPISKNNVATGVMSPLYTVFRFNNSHNDFYAYYFKTTGWHQYMRLASSTGARHDRMAIASGDFMAMPLPVASPEEQQKIADCLASLDKLITLEAQKLDTLKTHKKGLMQQFFPAEGETLPKLRFPEFRAAGEWEKKELRKIASILNKKAGSNKYRLMSITSGVGLVSQLEKFGREIAGAQYKNYLVIEKNDFAYNKSATKEYPEGFIVMYSGGEPGAVPNSIFTCFRVDANTVSQIYLDYLFIGNLHGKWLKKFITVGARAHGSLNIDDNDLLALPVPLPQGDHSLTEQQKIADCLASLDDLITAQTQKLAALKIHKKGLMQQLFPALDEVAV